MCVYVHICRINAWHSSRVLVCLFYECSQVELSYHMLYMPAYIQFTIRSHKLN